MSTRSTTRATPIMHLNGVNRRYQGLPKVGFFGLMGLGLAFWRLDRMVKRLPTAEPWMASGARRLDAKTLGAWFGSPWNVPSPTARKLINTTMTTLFCVDPNEVSLLGSLVLARGGGSFEYYVDAAITETHLVDGGAPEIAIRLAAKLGDALHLSTPVRRIRQTSAGVRSVLRPSGGRCPAGHRRCAAVPRWPDRIRSRASGSTRTIVASDGVRIGHPRHHDL